MGRWLSVCISSYIIPYIYMYIHMYIYAAAYLGGKGITDQVPYRGHLIAH
jgi:hypothetical protein